MAKKPFFAHLEYLTVKTHFSRDGRFRYSLVLEDCRGLKERTDSLTVMMLNPSQANEKQADKTIQFIEKLVFECGYKEFKNIGRIFIVNQFAYLQTKNFEGHKDQIGPRNNLFIRDALSKSHGVLIAWGRGNNFDERKDYFHKLLKSFKGPIFETIKHPSRGRYKDFIRPYHLPSLL